VFKIYIIDGWLDNGFTELHSVFVTVTALIKFNSNLKRKTKFKLQYSKIFVVVFPSPHM
jgi:hypothetical protein